MARRGIGIAAFVCALAGAAAAQDDLAKATDLREKGVVAMREGRVVDADALLHDAWRLVDGKAEIPEATAHEICWQYARAAKAAGFASGEPEKWDKQRLWEAVNCLDLLAQGATYGKDPGVHYELAELRGTMAPHETSYRDPMSADAVAGLLKVTEMDPNHKKAWWMLGKLRRDERLTAVYDPEAAKAALTRDLQVEPGREDSWAWLSAMALEADPKEAERLAQTGLGKAPDSGRLRFALGRAFEKQGSPKTAADQYAQAAARDPKNDEWVDAWVRSLIGSGVPQDQLLKTLATFSEKHSGHWKVDEIRAAILGQFQRHDEAIEVLKALAARFPDIPRGEEWELQQAKILLAVGPAGEERLVAAVVRALRRNPKSHAALDLLRDKDGQPLLEAWARAGQHDKVCDAVAQVTGVLATSPSEWAEMHAVLWRRASEAAYALGKAPEAEQAVRRAIQHDRRSPEHHLWAGLLLRAAGKVDAAVSEWREALDLRPNHPWAWQNIGVTRLANGQPREAREALLQGLEWLRDTERQVQSDAELAADAAFEAFLTRRALLDAWRIEQKK